MNNNGHHKPEPSVHLLGVKDGPFAGEKIVHFAISGRTIAATVSEQFIIHTKTDAMLKVEVYGNSEGMTLIGIPGECFATTRRQWIPNKELNLESPR